MDRFSYFLWSALATCTVIMACENYDFDQVKFTKVITVGAIEVSATSAFLTGDIEGLRAGRVIESGFVYSDHASNNESLRRGAPNVISQPSPFRDTITVDRAFAARITGLQQGTVYYFRAYIELEDETDLAYGQIDSFSTTVVELPIPTIVRQEAGCPTTVSVSFQINGYRPGPDRSTGFIWSNNEGVNYPSLQDGVVRQLESSSSNFSGDLEVDCDQTYFVRVFIQNTATEILYSDVISFSTKSGGSWIEQPAFPGPSVGREGPICFTSEHTLYLGAGGDDGINFNDFYQFIDTTKIWDFLYRLDTIELAHCGTSTLGSVGFAIGGRPSHESCLMCGLQSSDQNWQCICSSDRLLMFEPSDATWSTLGGIPGNGRRHYGTALTISEKLYFGLGIDFQACGRKVTPIRCRYFGDCGDQACGERADIEDGLFYLFSDIHSFDEGSLSWSKHDNLPASGRIGAVCFTIEDNGYLGMGHQVHAPAWVPPTFFENSTVLSDFHAFDPTHSSGNQWRQMDDFPEQYLNARGFGIGTKGYVIASTETEIKTFWQFDPNASSGQQWKALPDFRAAIEGTPQAAVVIGTKAFVYFNNNTDNFWMYVPELE
ncbi:MAG: hypothetical protein OEM26_08635 [Saprospiraceae bacterium]|nr:hypothetical protein [Saprospiraceae bacterium]